MKADQAAYAARKRPQTMVVRFGTVNMIGEFPYHGDARPGCGSKLVARTHRGTELCELLASTSHNSGGPDAPSFFAGHILRVADVADLNKQSALEAGKHFHIVKARLAVARLGLNMKIVDAEELLGGERITFYFMSRRDHHARVDFRPLVTELAREYHTRIEMRQIGARNEARLTGDYEKCGPHCGCKTLLKVIKRASRKHAKIQKVIFDPCDVPGRCGRLICCLRYEENAYGDLRQRLPHKKVAVMTPDGPGIVIDTQILTQLVLVRLDATNQDGAYPVENIELVTAGGPGAGGTTAAADDDAPSAAATGISTARADAGYRGLATTAPSGGRGRDGKDARDLNDPRDRRDDRQPSPPLPQPQQPQSPRTERGPLSSQDQSSRAPRPQGERRDGGGASAGRPQQQQQHGGAQSPSPQDRGPQGRGAGPGQGQGQPRNQPQQNPQRGSGGGASSAGRSPEAWPQNMGGPSQPRAPQRAPQSGPQSPPPPHTPPPSLPVYRPKSQTPTPPSTPPAQPPAQTPPPSAGAADGPPSA